MTLNFKIIQYSLQNDLYVEYFIWSYLRTLSTNGVYSKDQLLSANFSASLLKRKLKSNLFFRTHGNRIFLTSSKKINLRMSRGNVNIDMNYVSKFARKLNQNKNTIIKGWNNTLIKYLMISLYACRHGSKKPYALECIQADIQHSPSTIKRALNVFSVEKYYHRQEAFSGRSYHLGKEYVNLSPNYYRLILGETVDLKRITH